MQNWKTRIIVDPAVLAGKPIIKGTRLSVEHIVQRLADGWTVSEVLAAYPTLSPDDIAAVFAFVAAIMKDEEFIAIATAAA